jgi:hypothetical protein
MPTQRQIAETVAAALRPPDPQRVSSPVRRIDPTTGRVVAILPYSKYA